MLRVLLQQYQLVRRLLPLLLRVLGPRTGPRDGDLEKHHSFDPQVEAVVAPRSWVRGSACVPVCAACGAVAPWRAENRFCSRAVDQ